jgi:hypothetical protein
VVTVLFGSLRRNVDSLPMGSTCTEYEFTLMTQFLRHQKSETAAGARAVFPPSVTV